MFHVDNNSGVANMPALAPAQSNTTTWFTEGDGQKRYQLDWSGLAEYSPGRTAEYSG
ncbi:hypothetical protein OHD50_06910 [Escherichia coli]|nr:hypothetical protein [Escherichia coli]